MSEFTGERVIPGRVDAELWDEHIARYAFARTLAGGKRVLDIGCGTGYGTAELAESAHLAVGIDCAAEAFENARGGRALFLQASASALPFPRDFFDLVTAFEVIEHLADWDAMLAEARRVMRAEGLFIVSTPNQKYYAESRAKIGPNPFHAHEFQFEEFQRALSKHFHATTFYVQNRAEAFVFAPAGMARLEANTCTKPEAFDDAQFFVAICGIDSAPENAGFIHVPTSSNLLRERERHIGKLEDELALAKAWLEQMTSERDRLLEKHRKLTAHLEEQNRWALGLEKDWKAALARIAALQDEFHAEQRAAIKMARDYEQALSEARADSQEKGRWAMETEARLTEALRAKCEELAEAVRLLDRAEATVAERTVWAQTLQQTIDEMERRLKMIRASRWVRLGRAVGLGPRVDGR